MKKVSFSLVVVIIFYSITFILSDKINASEKTLTPLVLTISQPNKGNPPPIHYTKDPILLPEEKFTIKGIGQPNTTADMYCLSIVPGSDGSKDENRVITNFNAEIISDKIRFRWKPRRMFQKEHLMGEKFWEYFGSTNDEIFENFNSDADGIPNVLNFDFCDYESYEDAGNVNYKCDASRTTREGIYEYLGNSCEFLKTNCIIEDEIVDDIEDKNNGKCSMGNMPVDIDCFYNKKKYNVYTLDGTENRKYLVYDEIVKPKNCDPCDDKYLIKLDDANNNIPPNETINNTLVQNIFDVLSPEPPEDQEFNSIGFFYTHGPFDLSLKDDLSLDPFTDLLPHSDTGPNKIEVMIESKDPGNKTYVFSNIIELKTTLKNTETTEKSQINIVYEFEEDCLKIFESPKHTGGCHKPEKNRLICSENKLEAVESKEYWFKMQALNKRCQTTQVNVTVSTKTQEEEYDTEENYSKAYEKLQILEYKNPSLPLLNLSDKESITTGKFESDKTDIVIEPKIDKGKYLPNIRTKKYSNNYIFPYFNFNYAGYYREEADGSWEWEWAVGIMPIKDKIMLVDAFDQYEIYAIKKINHLAHKGIVREEDYKNDLKLIAIVKDPSAEYVDVKLDNFDPEEYIFAIFEVRESYFTNVPAIIKNAVENNFYIDIGGVKHNAVWGHLVTAESELELDLSNPAVKIAKVVDQPQKYEWEVFEQRKDNYYTSAPPILDPDGNINLAIPLKQFNRMADSRFLSGVYYSSDKPFSQSPKTFRMVSSRTIANFFNIGSMLNNNNLIRNSSTIHGVVFDTHTGNQIEKVNIHISGEQNIISDLFQPYQSFLTTSSDGYFEFDVGNGKYFLDVKSVEGISNNFTFDFSICPTAHIYPDQYCDKSKEIEITTSASKKIANIAVKPNIMGQINNANLNTYEVFIATSSGEEIKSTIANPDGKFSFFLPSGSYEISKVKLDGSDNEIPINNPVSSPGSVDFNIP